MSSSARARFLTSISALEQEVSELRANVRRLQEEQERWDELHKAGVPRRQIVASEYLREQQDLAAQEERRARDTERRALAVQQTCEKVERDSKDRVSRVEDAAHRAEENLAAAEASFNRWKQDSESAIAAAQDRHAQVIKQAVSHVEMAQAEAEARSSAAAERFSHERERCSDALSQAEAVRRQEERSLAAVRAKVSLAVAEHAEAQAHAAEHLVKVQKNHDKRREVASAREGEAVQDLQRRQQRSQAKMLEAERAREAVHGHCNQVEREQEAHLHKLRSEIEAKMLAWEYMANEAEAVAAQKVQEVQTLADRLRAAMAAEISAREEQIRSEAEGLRNRAAAQHQLLNSALDKHQSCTETVARIADSRVTGAETMSKQHVAQAESTVSERMAQAESQLKTVQGMLDGRVREAMGQLMVYLSEPGANK
mmetsp:Transcript_45026/g.106959  ORF Transcript_45026/g.106959 Transcript_45026/m.106959 type:complete len:427 (+) Transcript_45026:41-1321(+)